MKKVSALVLSMGLVLMPSFVRAAVATDAAPAAVEAAAVVDVGNKICPVSNEKVGGMGEVVKYEYNGKSYNLCCAMCKKDFEKDPAKYSKIAEDEVAGVK